MFHPNPTDFIAESDEYGALGRTMVALSNLEFAHDRFVCTMHETNQRLAVKLSRSFPRHFKQKTDFLINAIACNPKLRTVPVFTNGELNLIWLQYQFDELYGVRTIIAHGSVFYSIKTPKQITWTFEQFVRAGKNRWKTQAIEVSNGFLASVHMSAEAMKHYLVRLTHCLEGTSSWESEYQADKEIRRNNEYLKELIKLGVVDQGDSFFKTFTPKRPVD